MGSERKNPNSPMEVYPMLFFNNHGNDMIGSSKHAPWCFKELVEQMEKCGQWLYDHMRYGPIPKDDERENEIKCWFALALAMLVMALAGISPGVSLKVTLAVNEDKVHLKKTWATLGFLVVMVFIIFVLCLVMLSVTVTRPTPDRSIKIARTCGRFVLLGLVPIGVSAAVTIFDVTRKGKH